MDPRWELVATATFTAWASSLPKQDAARLLRTCSLLSDRGPLLGRPHADTLGGAKHPNLKELRHPGSTVRAFFAFDSQRRGVLLCGGDKAKSKKERTFYKNMIAKADALLDQITLAGSVQPATI